MKFNILLVVVTWLGFSSCGNSANDYDASGNFEAEEVIVSAQQSGVLLSFPINEGEKLTEGKVVGQIDVTIPTIQKQQVQASIQALKAKTSSSAEQIKLVKKQLAVQEAQLQQQLREQKRIENLVQEHAVPQKQLDDVNALVDQLQKQVAVTRQQMKLYTYNTATQNRSILSEQAPLKKAEQQYQELINKGQVINPITGVVLTKYANKGEMMVVGKPLYKIANTDTLTLRAYVTGTQLPLIQLGQQVQVRIDQGNKAYKNYAGIISWISDRSEFTPKTIQTKNERANLVYAIKVLVKNDGYLKIGMYGEAVFQEHKK